MNMVINLFRAPFHKTKVAINRTMDINRNSMANCVQFAINRNPL